MNKSDNINELASALAKAQGTMRFAVKDANNPFFKSKYADLSNIVEAIRDALASNGLSYIQRLHESEKHEVRVETVLLHASGQFVSCGILSVPVSKHDAQGFGSALTYARRYSLSAAVGVVADDDDGNAASQAVPKPSQPAPMPQKVKEAAKPKKAEPKPPIEGSAKTISSDPAEGDLSDLSPPPVATDKANPVVIGNIINAFASKLNMTTDQINAEFDKWMAGEQPARKLDEWTVADVEEARQMFKSMMAHKQEVL